MNHLQGQNYYLTVRPNTDDKYIATNIFIIDNNKNNFKNNKKSEIRLSKFV